MIISEENKEAHEEIRKTSIKEFCLSDKRYEYEGDYNDIMFAERDVKEFIRLLKEEMGVCHNSIMEEFIDKLAGSKLSGAKE